MTKGNIAFVSPNKIVFIDTDKKPVQHDVFYDGKICGSSLSRKKYVKPSPKWYAKKTIDFHPGDFIDYYQPRHVDVSQLSTGIDGVDSDVKRVKTYWDLKKELYFRANDISVVSLHPQRMTAMFEKEIIPKKEAVPYHSREVKKMSTRTAYKIQGKLNMWCYDQLFKNGFDHNKLNFKFITFTVTTPNFDHALTVKAWERFMSNFKKFQNQKKNNVFEYLWVAEKQDGRRSLQASVKAYELWQQTGLEHHKKRYDRLLLAGMNPTNNIHYHMIVDKFYDVKIMQHYWLAALEFYGAPRVNAAGKEYNPVQISPIRSDLGHISRYVAKYVTKNESELKCQLWHCSRKVSKFGTAVVKCGVALDTVRQFVNDQQAKFKVAVALSLCLSFGTAAAAPPLSNGKQVQNVDNQHIIYYVKSSRRRRFGAQTVAEWTSTHFSRIKSYVKQKLTPLLRAKPNVTMFEKDGVTVFYFKKMTSWLRRLSQPLFEYNSHYLPKFLATQ